MPFLVNLTLDLFQMISKLEIAMVLFSIFWWITCSSDPKRVWTVNLLHAVQLAKHFGDKALS